MFNKTPNPPTNNDLQKPITGTNVIGITKESGTESMTDSDNDNNDNVSSQGKGAIVNTKGQ